jgi:hypothetical protein
MENNDYGKIIKGTWWFNGKEQFIIDKDSYTICQLCGIKKDLNECKYCKSCYRDRKINQLLDGL